MKYTLFIRSRWCRALLVAGLTTFSGWLAAAPAMPTQPLRVACVGNSVTYGFRLPNPATQSYPSQLQLLLGDSYQVRNFGHSGATLLRQGHRPYIAQQAYRDALAFKADIVVIHLGLNDTDPRNWPRYRDAFIGDYLQLIQDFRDANPKARILICRMTPITSGHARFKAGTRDWFLQIQHAIEQVAAQAHVQLIDLHQPLYHFPQLFEDSLHPNPQGALILSRTVAQAITGQYGGLQVSPIYTDGMVLPRQKTIPLTGLANADVQVTVQLDRFKASTRTAADGTWQVTLPAQEAGGPHTLTISSSEQETLVLKDLYFGELWLCSGQSNMAFTVRQSAATEREEARQYAAQNTLLRLYNQKPYWETGSSAWRPTALDSTNMLQYYRPTTWALCQTENIDNTSAVAFHFGRMLADSLQVPIGLIINAIGGSPIEAWIDRATLELELPDILNDWMHNPLIDSWVRERALQNTARPVVDSLPAPSPAVAALQRHPYQPSYLFEAALLPLQDLPIDGVIWYQGESNADNMELHEKLFHRLVAGWRRFFPTDDQQTPLPFYYVQLSGINRPSWPVFRDSQRRLMQEIPATGMAVSSDFGDSLDVHPIHKQPVGERLALWALAQTYGFNLTPSGPLFRSATFAPDCAYVTFEYAQGLHAATPQDGQVATDTQGAAIVGFEIAAQEGQFVPALAVVQEKGCIKVYNPEVKNPRWVRYGWQPFTRANLVNEWGLPTSTFSTYPYR